MVWIVGIAEDKQINQKFDAAVDLVPKRSPLGADILHTQCEKLLVNGPRSLD
jgi:hypothetical protein